MSAERRSAVTTTSCNSSVLLAAVACGAAPCAQAPPEQASDAATAAAHCDRPRPVPLSHRAIPITPVRLLVCWTQSRGHGADRERARRGLGPSGSLVRALSRAVPMPLLIEIEWTRVEYTPTPSP